MILLDANLLIYSYISTMPQHARTVAWLNEQLATGTRIAIPWISLSAFIRIVTNRRLFDDAATVSAAIEQVDEWLETPGVWVPMPSARHSALIRDLAKSADASGDLILDVELAAFAIDHGLTLCSADRDFARFPGLRWINPLAA